MRWAWRLVNPRKTMSPSGKPSGDIVFLWLTNRHVQLILGWWLYNVVTNRMTSCCCTGNIQWLVATILPTFRTMDDWYVLTDMIENMLVTSWLLIIVQSTTDDFVSSIPPVMIGLRDAIEIIYTCCYQQHD